MATIVIPFRPNGKQRLARAAPRLAQAMLVDVLAACEPVARTLIAGAEGGQGPAVQAALVGLEGPVAIVNADLPCAQPEDIERLLAEAPSLGLALVEAADGTTNALALSSADVFQPLYGPGSAERFRAAAPSRTLAIENLADDVDTPDDLARLDGRLGPSTRAALAS
jgi:2-phospho-L-lactate guanylyltransferase (CobY/MobA/RfbA family)